jgi:hypothetical protein
MVYLFFFIGFGFLLTHEMDAIRQKEWTIFPLISGLGDKMGYYVFTGIHVPLYFLIFYGVFKDGLQLMNPSWIKGLDIFFIIHVFLHILYLNHKKNLFTSFFSWSLIAGAGICGLIDLIINFT